MRWAGRKHGNSESGNDSAKAFSMAGRTLDVDHAIDVHKDWSDHLFSALQKDAGASLDLKIISCPDCCDLGKWIHHGDGDRYLSSYMTFTHLRRTHQEFHQTAARVVMDFQQGYMDQALQLLHGQFYELSHEIIRALKNLKTFY